MDLSRNRNVSGIQMPDQIAPPCPAYIFDIKNAENPKAIPPMIDAVLLLPNLRMSIYINIAAPNIWMMYRQVMSLGSGIARHSQSSG
jgi:hypothetical protein